MDTNCIILAGGKGSRLGHDKLSETIASKSLLQQVISRVRLICQYIIVVTAREQDISRFVSHLKLRIVTDIFPGKGPMGGVYTGLATSTSLYNLVLACDMPFLNGDLLRYMIKLSANYDIVIPRVGDLVEPLHAVYSKRCIAPIEDMIRQDRLSVSDLLNVVRVRYVGTDEIDRFDPEHLSFFNINTKADMEMARELAGRMVSDDKC